MARNRRAADKEFIQHRAAQNTILKLVERRREKGFESRSSDREES